MADKKTGVVESADNKPSGDDTIKEDWEMDCEVLYADESSNGLVSSSEQANTITLLLTTTMIAGVSFITIPLIYPLLYGANIEQGVGHSGINYYWGLCAAWAAFFSMIKGVVSGAPAYLFVAVTIGMVFFGGSQSLKLAGIENTEDYMTYAPSMFKTLLFESELTPGPRVVAIAALFLSAIFVLLTASIKEIGAGFVTCLIFFGFVATGISMVARTDKYTTINNHVFTYIVIGAVLAGTMGAITGTVLNSKL